MNDEGHVFIDSQRFTFEYNMSLVLGFLGLGLEHGSFDGDRVNVCTAVVSLLLVFLELFALLFRLSFILSYSVFPYSFFGSLTAMPSTLTDKSV